MIGKGASSLLEPNMPQLDFFSQPARPWNAGRIIGAKPPFKPKHVWAIRQQLKTNGRTRDLALFDCAIDAKLRGCETIGSSRAEADRAITSARGSMLVWSTAGWL
jgi:hypothetical protein